MKNEYEIHGEYTVIYVGYQGQKLPCLIDTEDLPLVDLSENTLWYAISNTSGNMYVTDTHRAMHRLVTQAPRGQVVDHIYHDGLDNRKANLRVVPQSINSRNRKTCRGASGIRGVYWNKQLNKWSAQIGYNHRNINLGYFENKYEAGRAVVKAQLQYYDTYSVDRKPIILNQL